MKYFSSNPRATTNMADDDGTKKVHRARQSGPKAIKKQSGKHQPDKNRNPKAFSIQSVNKVAKQVHRSLDKETGKHHVPLVDRTAVEPPPVVVAIVGPPKVGKTTLINNLIKNYSREKISDLRGPVTIVSGIYFIFCRINIFYNFADDIGLCQFAEGSASRRNLGCGM